MGKFRREHGKTRLRALIDNAKEKGVNLPAEILDVASMVFPPVSLVRSVIQKVSDLAGIDPSVKAEALSELDEWALELEREITERHSADMNSDSWLSKNIRPIIAISILADFLIYKSFSIFWKGLNIDPNIINRGFDLVEWVLAFYLGFKGVERIAKNVRIRG